MKKTILALAIVAIMSGALAEKVDHLKLAVNMYSNQRAWKVGDLVTVNILEETSSKKSESHAANKETKADAEAPIFGANPAATQFTGISDALHKNVDIPSYKIEAKSSFTGTGSTKSEEQLVASITCRIVDVLENGVMVVRGDRKIIMRNESINLVVTGLIRSRDISSGNTINSNQMADAHIYYETDGEVSRGSRAGWAWRIFTLLNPF